MTQFKPVAVEDGVVLLGLDTMTPPGIYFRPFTDAELEAGAGPALAFPGDFFLLGLNQDGALRATLLPWTAPAFGNQYPKGDHGQAGEWFDPREIAGPWIPFRPIPKTESVTGSYIGAEYHEQVAGELRSQVHDAQGIIEDAGQLVGMLRGALDLGVQAGRADAARKMALDSEELGKGLSIRAEAWVRDVRLRRAGALLQDAPATRTSEAHP